MYGKSQFLMGKSTVTSVFGKRLPEGNHHPLTIAWFPHIRGIRVPIAQPPGASDDAP